MNINFKDTYHIDDLVPFFKGMGYRIRDIQLGTVFNALHEIDDELISFSFTSIDEDHNEYTLRGCHSYKDDGMSYKTDLKEWNNETRHN